jgi:hypothetical protein
VKRTKKNKPSRSVTIGFFKSDEEDESNCIGSVVKGRTYFFFLKKQGEKPGLRFKLNTLPVRKSKKHARLVRKILGKKGAQRPRIRSLQGPKQRVAPGTKVTLKCKAKGNPRPVFSWYKDGELVTNKKGVRVKDGKGRNSKLTIKKASSKDKGVYECLVRNAVGEARKEFELKVREQQHAVPCDSQTFCLNYGTCMHNEDVGLTFCV